ncbi:MAG: endonuclease domain-containing protein [Candidatus Neomarinimicrobiota bacterium]
MPNITQTCRDLRKRSTPAEKAFWQTVRNRQFRGLKFNRQYPILFEYDTDKRIFIADFYCHQLQLIVEIDGGVHEQQKDYDTLRTVILNNLEYKVIRFSNHDILNKLDQVLKRLGDFIELTPNPSLKKIDGKTYSPLLSREKGPACPPKARRRGDES